MKKAEFVEILANKHEMPKKAMDGIVDSIFELVVKVIKKGDEVVFPYGKFVLKKKPAREGRNPLTGDTIKVPAKVVPQFKPAKRFKDEVAS